MLSAGQHGLSEVLYAFTSSAANNGSAFGGFSGNTTLVQRRVSVGHGGWEFIPIIVVMALAGTFAGQRPGVVTAGTLRATNRRSSC